MLDVIFWIIYLLTPYLMFLLLRKSGESLNSISIVNITALSIYMFSVIGTFPLFYHLDEYSLSIGINDKELILKVLFLSSVNLLFFLLGVIFSRKVIKLRPISIRSSEIVPLRRSQYIAVLVVFMLLVLVLLSYLSKVDKIALIEVFKGDVLGGKVARSSMTNNFSGGYHWYSLILFGIGNIITLTLYITLLLKKRRKFFVYFIISFTFSVFVSLMSTQKAPFIDLIAALIMAHFIARNNGYLPKKTLITLSAFTVSILVLFYMFIFGFSTPQDAFNAMISRAFSGSIAPAYFYLEYFPYYQDYLFGLTFPNPGGLMPYTPVPYTVEISDWVNPHFVDLDVVGSMPTVFWGESYVNFGVFSIPIIAFLIGIFVSIISYIISKIELNPLSIALTIWTIFYFRVLSISGFSNFLYDIKLIIIATLVFFIFALERTIRIRKHSYNHH